MIRMLMKTNHSSCQHSDWKQSHQFHRITATSRTFHQKFNFQLLLSKVENLRCRGGAVWLHLFLAWKITLHVTVCIYEHIVDVISTWNIVLFCLFQLIKPQKNLCDAYHVLSVCLTVLWCYVVFNSIASDMKGEWCIMLIRFFLMP